jgi:hypothetical protein
MELTKKEMLLWWQKSVDNHIRPWANRVRPRFRLAETVQIVKNEPNLRPWTYMDDVRLARKGCRGIIVDIHSLPDKDVPMNQSNYDYRVLFPDGSIITFVEEHLLGIQ